jgi:hypothetical protein
VLASTVSNFGLTNQQDTGELIAYGLSDDNYELLIARKAQGSDFYFAATYLSVLTMIEYKPVIISLSGGVELCAVDSSHWHWFSLLDWAELPDVLGMAVGGAQDASVMFYPVFDQSQSGPTGFSSLVRLPWARAVLAPYAAVMDGSSNVQMVSVASSVQSDEFYAGTFLPLTGRNTQLPNGVAAVAAVLQSDSGSAPQPRLYAMASTTAGGTTALWVLRQIDASVPMSQPSAWSSWTPLGDDYLALANGPCLLDTDMLFAVSNADGSVQSVSQDPVSGRWTSQQLKRPSQAGDEIEAVAMYHTEITFCDSGGVPQVNVPVTITAATPVAVCVEDVVYRIDSNQGVTCPTNASGQLHTRTLATGLHTPILTFQADGLSNGGQSIYPSQHVHDFLAGTGQLAVGGGQPTSFTATTLQNATVGTGTNRQPLSPGLTQATAQQTVTWSSQITAMPTGSAPGAAGVAGWAVDLSDPAHPTFHTFSTRVALAAYRQQIAQKQLEAGLPGSIWGHLWHGIKHAADDVVHAIEKDVAKVDQIVVDVENKVVSLTLKIGDQIIGTFDMVVRTVEDALRAIEAILHTLIADIEKIIEWLMMLLDWQDIWHTKEVLEELITQSMVVLQGQIGTIRTKVQEVVFATLQKKIEQAFQSALADFPYQSFGDLPSTSQAAARFLTSRVALPSGGMVGGHTPGITIPTVSSVHQNWMLSKTTRSLTPSTTYGSGSVDATHLLSAFNGANVVDNIVQATQSFLNYLEAVFKDPKAFLSLTIVEFLQQAENLILAVVDILDDLVGCFLGVIEQALGGFTSIFNHSLDIPIISALYKFLFHEDLTVLHLCTLLIAIPLTILYKLMHGGQAPFSGVDADALRRVAMNRASAEASTLLAPASPASLPISVQQWKDVYLAVGLFNAVVVGIGDVVTIAQGPESSEYQNLNIVGKLTTLLSDVSTVVMQISSWPAVLGGFPNANLPSDMSPADASALANWVSYWFQPCWDINGLTMPAETSFPPELVLGISTMLGTISMITAIIAIATGKSADPPLSGAGQAEFALGPFGSLMAWILLPEIRIPLFDSTDELGYRLDTAIGKLALDAAVNIAVPILNDLP